LRHYYRLACRYPELKLILAHWGGGLIFYEMMPRVRRDLQNVWYDTAASPLLYPTTRIFRAALESAGQHKILMASDYPLLLYPGRQRQPDFRPFLAEIDQLGLTHDVNDDLMGNNAARLLGLDEASQPAAAEDRSGPETTVKLRRKEALLVVDPPEDKAADIELCMTVTMVAQCWPQTQAVFDQYGIPWQDSPVPYWEPIVQAAAGDVFIEEVRAHERGALVAGRDAHHIGDRFGFTIGNDFVLIHKF